MQEQPEVHEGEALAVFTYGDKVDEGAIVQEGGVWSGLSKSSLVYQKLEDGLERVC